MNIKDHIPNHLLWEYDTDTFNYDKSYKIVVERVLELGDLNEWRAIVQYYDKEKIKGVIEWSAQLDKRNKSFCRSFLNSDLLNVASQPIHN